MNHQAQFQIQNISSPEITFNKQALSDRSHASYYNNPAKLQDLAPKNSQNTFSYSNDKVNIFQTKNHKSIIE